MIYFHAQLYPEWVLFSVPKSEKNRSKYAGPIYFHAQVYPEWVSWKGISQVVFTNFPATLARQPSAASLAPRLNYVTSFSYCFLIQKSYWKNSIQWKLKMSTSFYIPKLPSKTQDLTEKLERGIYKRQNIINIRNACVNTKLASNPKPHCLSTSKLVARLS